MKSSGIFFGVVFLVLFTLTVSLAQSKKTLQIEPIPSDKIPVKLIFPVVYESDEGEGIVHNINFSLANDSELYIGRAAFIGYMLDEKGEETITSFWSYREGIKPGETTFTPTRQTANLSDTTLLICLHTICTNKGTWQMDLSKVRKAIFPYAKGKEIILPEPEFSIAKCTED